MKKILVFFLVMFSSNVFSENTIIALVNNTPVTLNSVQINLKNIVSKMKESIVRK